MIYKSILLSTRYFIGFDIYTVQASCLKSFTLTLTLLNFPKILVCCREFQAGEIGPNSPRDVVWIMHRYLSVYIHVKSESLTFYHLAWVNLIMITSLTLIYWLALFTV